MKKMFALMLTLGLLVGVSTGFATSKQIVAFCGPSYYDTQSYGTFESQNTGTYTGYCGGPYRGGCGGNYYR